MQLKLAVMMTQSAGQITLEMVGGAAPEVGMACSKILLHQEGPSRPRSRSTMDRTARVPQTSMALVFRVSRLLLRVRSCWVLRPLAGLL